MNLQPASMPQVNGPVSMPAADPTAWIGELSPEKRAIVDDIFNRHAENVRARLPMDGPPSDPALMKQVMEESDQQLRQELKSALSDKEYGKFLSSLPQPPKSLGQAN